MNKRTAGRLVAIAALVAAFVPAVPGTGGAAAQVCPRFGASTVTGSIQSSDLDETSGVVASRNHPGILWANNDSGNTNHIYALNKSGATKMKLSMGSINNWDFEDIAIGPGPKAGKDYLYIADIGANKRGRDTVRIYRFAEPASIQSGTHTIPADDIVRFDVAYQKPGAAAGVTWNRNAESMTVDPTNGDLIIVEKELNTVDGLSDTSWVYRIRQSELDAGKVTLAKPMAAPRTRYDDGVAPTAADFSPDGKVLFIKNSREILAWTRDGGSIYDALRADRTTDCRWAKARGEALAVAADGTSLYSVPEGRHAEILRINITLPGGGGGGGDLTCRGLDVTIAGTPGNDTITGTPDRDVIHGRGGADVIEGRGGNDVICGGIGPDTVRGGNGKDRITGGKGHDLLIGQDGRDRLRGAKGDDTLWGGPGFDILVGGAGNDTCATGPDGGIKDC